MNFKPTMWKVIVSIIVVVIWYFFQIYTSIDCSVVDVFCTLGCDGVFTFLPKCCKCISFNENFKDFILIIIPGIIIYVILSLFDKNEVRKKK